MLLAKLGHSTCNAGISWSFSESSAIRKLKQVMNHLSLADNHTYYPPMTLTEVARAHNISRALVSKIVRQGPPAASHKGSATAPSQLHEHMPQKRRPEVATKHWLREQQMRTRK
jgi:hypothetical protein